MRPAVGWYACDSSDPRTAGPTINHPVRCLLCLTTMEARDVPSHAGIWPVYHDGKLIAAEVEPCRAG